MEVLTTYMSYKPPKDMHANSQSRELEITWKPGHVGYYPYRNLRLACPCAGCVDEMTNKRIIDPATIPDVPVSAGGWPGTIVARENMRINLL